MAIVTVDTDTNAVTVDATAPTSVEVVTGPGNPSYYPTVITYLNQSGLSPNRTLPSGYSVNQLAEVVLAIIADLQNAGIFVQAQQPTSVASSTVIYV